MAIHNGIYGWGLFHAAKLEGFDHFTTEEDKERDHRDSSKDRTGHQACPIRNTRLLLRPKRIDCYSYYANRFLSPDKKWPEEFVPSRYSRQDGQRSQRGTMYRQDHTKEN